MQKDMPTLYRNAGNRLFLLDYDGTLVGFKPTPPEAKPTQKLLEVLAKLTADPRNTIAIISGRDKYTLEKWLGQLPLLLIAEHGCFVRRPGRDWEAISPVPDDWKKSVKEAIQKSISAVSGTDIEEKDSSIVWHYRTAADKNMAEAEIPKLTKRLTEAAMRYSLNVMKGSNIVEVRPNNVNKGSAATYWLKQQDWDFVLAAGDDTTDEDLFAAMPSSAFTIKVREGETKAAARVADHDALLDLLSALTES